MAVVRVLYCVPGTPGWPFRQTLCYNDSMWMRCLLILRSSERFCRWFSRHVAVIVAAAALTVSGITAYYQVSNWALQRENDRQERLHDRLSVRPILRFAMDFSYELPRFREVGLHLVNVGNGIAFIEDYEVALESTSPSEREALERLGFREHPLEALARFLETEHSVRSIQRPLAIMDVLPEGESLCLLGLSPSAEKSHVEKLIWLIGRLGIDVPYKSAYDEWQTVNLEPDPELLLKLVGPDGDLN
jgi:hypothetical protein